MFFRVNDKTAFLASVSVGALWCYQALAAPTSTPLTCEIGDPASTLQTCDSLIEHYKQGLSVTEHGIRSMSPDDPERSKQMKLYAKIQKKLEQIIANKAKIQSSSTPKGAQKSTFRWNQPNFRRFDVPNVTTVQSASHNWSGIGTAVQSTFGISNIYRVTGTFVVPAATIPDNLSCNSNYTNFTSDAWVGLGGDDNTSYDIDAFDNWNSELYQAGIEIDYVCYDLTPRYYVWYEDFPANSKPVFISNDTDLPLVPGDIVQIIVSYPPGDVNKSGSTMNVEAHVTSTAHANWNKLISVQSPNHSPPRGTAEAVVERVCNSTATYTDSKGKSVSYCTPAGTGWYSPMAFPQSATSGSFVMTDLKYSLAGNPDTEETDLNTPVISPYCSNLIQQDVPSQCTVNVWYTPSPDECDNISATATSDTVTTVAYLPGDGRPDVDNGLCIL